MQPQVVKIQFSIKSILTVLAVLAGLWFALQVKDIIIIVFVAFILTSAIEPMALYLNRYRVPHVLSMAIAYAAVLLLLIGLGFMVVPPLIAQIDQLINNMPHFTAKAVEVLAGQGINEGQVQQYLDNLTKFLAARADQLSSSVVEVGLGVVSGLFTVVTIVVASFYILLEKKRLYEGLELIVTPRRYRSIQPIIIRVEDRLGAWARGQLLLGFIIGVTTWIGLTLLNIPYALPLAIIAGLFELIPLVGPLLSAIPTIVVALTISPTMAIAVIILYIVIQQLESNWIVPKVMQKAVGLNPFLILIAILAGGTIMGVVGALLAIPVAVVLATILEEVALSDKQPSLPQSNPNPQSKPAKS